MLLNNFCTITALAIFLKRFSCDKLRQPVSERALLSGGVYLEWFWLATDQWRHPPNPQPDSRVSNSKLQEEENSTKNKNNNKNDNENWPVYVCIYEEEK